MSNDSSSTSDEQEVYFGTPTMAEMKRYLQSLQRRPLDQNDLSPEPTDESSFELDDSFHAMIERKRKQLLEARFALDSNATADEDDVGDVSATASTHFTGGGDADSQFRGNDSTFIEQDSIQKTTDESFEQMERLCSVNESQFGEVMSPTAGEEEDDEELAIKRILGGREKGEMGPPKRNTPIKKRTQPSHEDQSICLAEMTQLEDVEEPSGMWDNSILPQQSTGISPVKRVHMLRPSTIIEEATINETASNNTNSSSKNTSLDSYITAKVNLNGSDNCSVVTGSEVYRTAEEGYDNESQASSSVGFDSTVNKTSIETSSYSKNMTLLANEKEAVEQDDDEGDVIVLSSSESEAEESISELDKELDASSVLENSDSLQENSLCGNDPEISIEAPGSPVLDDIPDHLNDTMEQMEFMMRQGMKLMQQKKQQEQNKQPPSRLSPYGSSSKKTATPVSTASASRYLKPTQPSSQCQQLPFSHYNSASKSAQKPSSAPSSAVTGSGGLFKKPMVSRFPLPKSAKKFDHIVSPIGAYIKTTPKNQLQARMFQPTQNLVEELHSKPEHRESYKPSGSKENFTHQSEPMVDPTTYSSSLPRKGLASSRGAHVLDERQAVRIPGGEKVHKLLNNSPTLVIRHEGRLKYQREMKLTDDSVTGADESMADLSIASGDVSVRVVKDVRRF